MNDLIKNMEKLHTTELGIQRIRKNLQIDTDDVVLFCKLKISDNHAIFEKTGKNWYIVTGNCKITVNAHSYTIITAHKL